MVWRGAPGGTLEDAHNSILPTLTRMIQSKIPLCSPRQMIIGEDVSSYVQRLTSIVCGIFYEGRLALDGYAAVL